MILRIPHNQTCTYVFYGIEVKRKHVATFVQGHTFIRPTEKVLDVNLFQQEFRISHANSIDKFIFNNLMTLTPFGSQTILQLSVGD